jgi:hypothetical protein
MMLSGEQKITRGFHWVAVLLAALLIETLRPAQSAKFFNHDGRQHPW